MTYNEWWDATGKDGTPHVNYTFGEEVWEAARKDPEDLETRVNEVLLSNGWDYDDRKRVLFKLRNTRNDV